MDPHVRDATADDVAAITDIYNQVVATSDAIWRDEPVTVADRQAWFAAQQATGMPALVAVDAGGAVVGFASFVQFRTIPGYFPSVEHTIHVADGHRGQGVGGRLLDALVERAVAMGKAVMIAGADGGNLGSIRFHERAGFREVARLPGVGRKHGRPVDLVLLQRDLPAPPDAPDGSRP
ncbi:GNAT family N-acetyltransferase [Aquihabitans sp. G128]|uniref:GNAT family N-acetyltransferase n=1 Tax=Aquihabitans sp. G128 TaxID=2849779 RepID=UPI001C211F52|nr:GNAT family N-acetyltransferase [Aquihabitans sp. G128]QXC62965.1 GNAT family N-acetyltransferase [Aquihabitans sp. G128]